MNPHKHVRDLTGLGFGDYVVVRQAKSIPRCTRWKIKCKYCDKTRIVRRDVLSNGRGDKCPECTNNRGTVTDIERKLIVDLYAYGIAGEVIHSLLGISVRTIYNIITPNRHKEIK